MRRAKGAALAAWIARNADTALVVATLVVLVVGLAITRPRFLAAENIVSLMYDSMVLLVVSVGMTIVVVGGGLDLSVGSLAALASSIGALAMLRLGVAPGLLAGFAAGTSAGLVNGLVVTRLAIDPFIATLAMMVGARGFAYTLTNAGSVMLPAAFSQLAKGSVLGVPNLLVVTLVVFLAGYYLLHHTPFGLDVFAVGGKRDAARLAGVATRRIATWTYVLSGFTAATAGLMLTLRFNSGLPTTGTFLELTSVAAVVLGGTRLAGGRGGMARTLAGVLLIAVLQNGLDLFNIPYEWQQVAIGLVFIAAAASGTPRRPRLRSAAS